MRHERREGVWCDDDDVDAGCSWIGMPRPKPTGFALTGAAWRVRQEICEVVWCDDDDDCGSSWFGMPRPPPNMTELRLQRRGVGWRSSIAIVQFKYIDLIFIDWKNNYDIVLTRDFNFEYVKTNHMQY